ncbi:MAG: peptidase S9 [Candidatus Yanofskybacteria bacterium RIFCSPHIGHO2_01_FULL_41_21]|uniref:Peptidase S9 n=1 Tax=Candidatus Yanofskybacteria bacterium RIFCSPHIGHO2_01_FULL_41_21 TaxID=1802660 RepID=A0A1F8EE26_9BACT|nr:MAG: peptidase S9 [Candidatus Yanofskybacteria bacterium RIFCSPHIGHO2_01_FULL_41_21]
MEKEFNGRDLKLGQIQDGNSDYTRYHITYKSGDLTISGIMNIPKGIPPEDGWPVLFLNHGHIDTSVYTNGRGLRREQDYLARQGFAVLHSDYRNHTQSDKDPNTETDVRLGYVEDVINAVMAVKNSDISSLSKERFGMLGHSMGGGISQAVMVVRPDLVDAIVLYAPVSSDVVDSYNRWTLRNSSNAEKIRSAHGSPEENPEFWKNMSPRTFFDRVKTPIIIFHGTADESCDIEWSRETRELLLAAGKRVELVEYPGQYHEFGATFDDFMKRSSDFFKNNLK